MANDSIQKYSSPWIKKQKTIDKIVGQSSSCYICKYGKTQAERYKQVGRIIYDKSLSISVKIGLYSSLQNRAATRCTLYREWNVR